MGRGARQVAARGSRERKKRKEGRREEGKGGKQGAVSRVHEQEEQTMKAEENYSGRPCSWLNPQPCAALQQQRREQRMALGLPKLVWWVES